MTATGPVIQGLGHALRAYRRGATSRQAKILAAARYTSISGLLARQIEMLGGENDAYEQARQRALASSTRDSTSAAAIDARWCVAATTADITAAFEICGNGSPIGERGGTAD